MKKFILFFGLLFLINCVTKPVINENEISINAKQPIKVANNYELKIEKVFSDSRCPMDVDCIRAGEVELQIGVFQKEKLQKSESLIINSKNFEQNKTFFKSYVSENKKIKSIFITPSKMQGKNIEFEEYVLKIIID